MRQEIRRQAAEEEEIRQGIWGFALRVDLRRTNPRREANFRDTNFRDRNF